MCMRFQKDIRQSLNLGTVIKSMLAKRMEDYLKEEANNKDDEYEEGEEE